MTADPNSARQRRRRAEKRRQIGIADAACEVLLAVVVVGSALAVGTVHVSVLLGVSALAIVGGTLGAMALRRVPGPAIVLVALGLFSLLQALPLPAGLVQRLSPASAEVWLRCLIPFGEKPLRSFPLSIDSGASIAEALKLVTYASVYLMATRIRARRGSAWLAVLLFGSAGLVTLITLVHGVADLDVLYGFYRPNFTVGRWHVGPLLNSNNLAGYAILGLFAGIGLLIRGHSPLPRMPLLIGVGIISTALCLSGSRAGLVSAIFGGFTVVLWSWRTRHLRFSTRRTVGGIAPFLIGIVVAVALGTSKEWGDLATLDVRRKVEVWHWSLAMIRDHAIFGIGRGAFETGFAPYRQALDYDWSIVVTYAENFAVQWIAEWGIPLGLCAIVVIVGYIVREWLANTGDRLGFLLMTGLVALFLQNLADLGLETPAVAIAAVLALAAGERLSPRPPSQPESRVGLRALACLPPTIGLWVAVIVYSNSAVAVERWELSHAYRELPLRSADERVQFRGLLHDAILRHPGESFFPLLGALVAYRAHEGNPLRWVARALELSPSNASAHLVLAHLLHAHGATTQAMLHLRLAAEYDRTLQGAVSDSAVRWAPSIDVLMQAVPDGPTGDAVLVEACGKESRRAATIDCLRRAIARNPSNATAQAALAGALISTMGAQQSPCSGNSSDSCVVEADTAIRSMAKLEPRSWRAGYLMSKLLMLRGDIKGAAQLLARVCPPDAQGDECSRDAVIVAIKSNSNAAISSASSAYAARTCDSNTACADALEWLATALESGGKHALAVSFFAKAAEMDASADRWLKVADHAAQAQLYGVARNAVERANRSPDATPETKAHSDQLLLRVAAAMRPGQL